MHWTHYITNIIRSVAKTASTGRITVYNGVATRDTALTAREYHYPDHKQELCNAITRTVTPSDDVAIVGGGRGVAAVHAARQNATVTVYEAAQEMIDELHETARLNQVDYDIQHAVVGPAYDVFGTAGDAAHVQPTDLSGDVLVLDCEGAEQDILPQDDFESVIVETHPRQGASTDDILPLVDNGKVFAADPVAGDVVIAGQDRTGLRQ